MNLTRQMKDIENLYNEKVSFPTKDTFELAKDAKEKKKPFISKPSGPAEASGFKEEICDPKKLKGEETFQGAEKLSSQNFKENIEKSEQKEINTFMSKSNFDKLFEDVMGASTDAQDAVDLGIDVGGEEAGASEGEVSFSLPRDLAEKLHEVLAAVLGGEEDKGEEEVGGEEAGAEGESEDAEAPAAPSEDAEEKKDKKEDEKEESHKEATELKEVPASAGHSLTGKNNKVGGTVDSLVAKGHGDGKVKGEVDGKGKDLPDSAGAKLQSKNNKVPNKHNVGDYLYKK